MDLFKHENEQKQRQLKISTLFRHAIYSDPKISNPDKKIYNIYYCGAYRRYDLDTTRKHKRLAFACFCNERLCPQCGRHKAFKARIKLSTMFKYLNEHYAYKNGNPKYIPIFATLTIPNVKDDPKAFKKTYKNLHHKFSSMMKYKRFCGFIKSSKKNLKGAIQGGVSKIEVTYNRKHDTFHLHLHALLLVHRSYFTSRYYINHNQWQSAWEKVWHWNAKRMGHHLEVRIERPYYKDKHGNAHSATICDDNETQGAEREAITEVTGYETKSDDFTKILDKNDNKSSKFISKHLKQAQKAFDTAYFGTKNQDMYTYFGLLGKLSKMYNNGDLDKFKPKDKHVYEYLMLAKYHEAAKQFKTDDRKMTNKEMKDLEAKGLRTVLSHPTKEPVNPDKILGRDESKLHVWTGVHDQLNYLKRQKKNAKRSKPAKAGLRKATRKQADRSASAECTSKEDMENYQSPLFA